MPIWWKAVPEPPCHEDWLVVGVEMREVTAVEGHVGGVVGEVLDSQKKRPTWGSAADLGVRPTLAACIIGLSGHACAYYAHH